jgi:hypothetical protein
MKTNLKLSKITISKLDNLNFASLENEQLINVKGGEPTPSVTFPGSPTVTRPGNDTTHLSSCQLDWEGNVSYTECISRDS